MHTRSADKPVDYGWGPHHTDEEEKKQLIADGLYSERDQGLKILGVPIGHPNCIANEMRKILQKFFEIRLFPLPT